MSLLIEEIIREDLSKIAKAKDNSAIVDTMKHTRRQIKDAMPDCTVHHQRDTMKALDNAFANIIPRLNAKTAVS